MNWRTTGLLFLVLAGLIGYVVWDSRQEETAVSSTESTPEIPPTPVRVTLIATTNDSIQGIGIKDLAEDDEVLYTQAEPGAWQQTLPEESAVISATLNTAVSGILNLTSTRTLSADENDLSAYGLDAPAHQINIAINNAEEDRVVRVTLLVGNQTPVGTANYIIKEGDPRIHIVPNGLIENLTNLLTDPPLADSEEQTTE